MNDRNRQQLVDELNDRNRPQVVDELKKIPWGHHRFIIDSCKVCTKYQIG